MVTFPTKEAVWRRKWKGVCTVNSNSNYVGVQERHLYCKSSPITGLEWPIGFQEVKVPIFHDTGTEWW
jgi:hypothetical protein